MDMGKGEAFYAGAPFAAKQCEDGSVTKTEALCRRNGHGEGGSLLRERHRVARSALRGLLQYVRRINRAAEAASDLRNGTHCAHNVGAARRTTGNAAAGV